MCAGSWAVCVSKSVEILCTGWQQFQVVRGNFSQLFLRTGYHKISEIPAGARNLSIQETKKSRNYLGTHTHTHMCTMTHAQREKLHPKCFPPALLTKAGISIINGKWAIDRPGMFTAVGTQLMYLRPSEIRSRSGESITAPGPLTEDLHLYVRKQWFPSVPNCVFNPCPSVS